MTTAADLRAALDVVRDGSGTVKLWPAKQLVNAAARLWLRILEGDEQTVEKVRAVLQRNWEDQAPDAIAELDARAVLAALAEGEKT